MIERKIVSFQIGTEQYYFYILLFFFFWKTAFCFILFLNDFAMQKHGTVNLEYVVLTPSQGFHGHIHLSGWRQYLASPYKEKGGQIFYKNVPAKL